MIRGTGDSDRQLVAKWTWKEEDHQPSLPLALKLHRRLVWQM